MDRLKPSALQPYLLPMLVVGCGVQALRALIPLVVWHQPQHASYMLLALLAGFLTPFLVAVLGSKRSLWMTCGSLALLRLIEVVSKNAALDLWIGTLSVASFAVFLPLFLSRSLAGRGKQPPIRWGLGLLLGFAFDTTLRILLATRDLGAIAGFPPILLQASLSASIFLLLAGEEMPAESATGDCSRSSSVLLLFLGPFLLFELLMFQNPSMISQRLAIELRYASLFVSLGNLLAILGFSIRLLRPRVAALFSLVLISVPFPLLLSLEMNEGALLILLPLAQFGVGWFLAQILIALQPAARPYPINLSLASALSMILFMLFLFLSFGQLILANPFPPESASAVFWGFFGLLGLSAAYRARALFKPIPSLAALLIPAIFLMMTATHNRFASPRLPSASHARMPLKLMTYNIHSAFSVFGQSDPEAIARVIENSGADLVALQEISRAWLASGSTDLVDWLSQRLQMHAVFQGTADHLWGNAILSRYPFAESGHGDLPQLSSLVPRGYLWVKLDVGKSEPLLIITTHLHHVQPGEEVRLAQIETILNAWNDAPFTVFLGDMNATPGTPEIRTMSEAGFIDAWATSGMGQEFTLFSLAPDVRVDWIWHTPDLVALEARVIDSLASDHLPVIAEITFAQ